MTNKTIIALISTDYYFKNKLLFRKFKKKFWCLKFEIKSIDGARIALRKPITRSQEHILFRVTSRLVSVPIIFILNHPIYLHIYLIFLFILY